MTENSAKSSRKRSERRGLSAGWRVVGWVFLGLVGGAVLAGVFLAYGQPELLLEQLNLRYCG